MDTYATPFDFRIYFRVHEVSHFTHKLSMTYLGNLLLHNDKMQILLTNFETAREEISGEMTSEAGTYRYMAPEVHVIYLFLYNHHLLEFSSCVLMSNPSIICTSYSARIHFRKEKRNAMTTG